MTWQLRRSTKQVVHPKFYFFDTGVVRALNQRLSFPLLPEEEGSLLETHLLGEIRAYLGYHQLDYPLSFWRSPNDVEVDVLCETPKGFVGIEVKASVSWRSQFSCGLSRLSEEFGKNVFLPIGVYQGQQQLNKGHMVYSVADFLKRLWNGEIIS